MKKKKKPKLREVKYLAQGHVAIKLGLGAQVS